MINYIVVNGVKPDLKGWLELQDKEDSQYALNTDQAGEKKKKRNTLQNRGKNHTFMAWEDIGTIYVLQLPPIF